MIEKIVFIFCPLAVVSLMVIASEELGYAWAFDDFYSRAMLSVTVAAAVWMIAAPFVLVGAMFYRKVRGI